MGSTSNEPNGVNSGPADLAGYLDTGLPALLDAVRRTDVAELELQEGDLKLRVQRRVSQRSVVAQPSTSMDTEPDLATIVSPLVGTFYRASQPGMPPLAEEGTVVEPDTVVGIVDSLRVLTEIPAGCRGTVSRVLATDGSPVQYGQVLFEVRPGG